MIKQLIVDFYTRLARAVLIRLSEDVEVMQAVQSGMSSGAFASSKLSNAKPISTREILLRESLKFASDGMICEFGVYRGATLSLISDARPDNKVYGFDSFEGLPETWRSRFPGGTFKIDTTQLPSFRENVVLYSGLFHETLPQCLHDDDRHAAFLHVDCDLYSSTRCIFDLLSDRFREGTVIVFDEYFNYPGWEQHEHRALIEAADKAGFTFDYLLYNPRGQQVAIIIRSVKSP